ncbi:MAG: hypothetical protein ACOCTG_00740 [Bacteroidota bacterium]
MTRCLAVLVLVLLLLVVGRDAAIAQTPSLVVEVEAGPVWQNVNEVQIPNDETASRFSLVDLIGNGPWPAPRLYLTWNLAERHGLRVLVAPLSVTETGVPERALSFAGAEYEAGQATQATYTFNSYRLSYRFRWHSGGRTAAWVGFTAKVRDAVVELEQAPISSRKTDLGFVPLLHVAGDWQFAPRWHLGLDVDALAGGPGRAIDGSLKVGYYVSDRWRIRGGYRTVEGGADVTEVYNFAWLHYAVVSVQWIW